MFPAEVPPQFDVQNVADEHDHRRGHPEEYQQAKQDQERAGIRIQGKAGEEPVKNLHWNSHAPC